MKIWDLFLEEKEVVFFISLFKSEIPFFHKKSKTKGAIISFSRSLFLAFQKNENTFYYFVKQQQRELVS